MRSTVCALPMVMSDGSCPTSDRRGLGLGKELICINPPESCIACCNLRCARVRNASGAKKHVVYFTRAAHHGSLAPRARCAVALLPGSNSQLEKLRACPCCLPLPVTSFVHLSHLEITFRNVISPTCVFGMFVLHPQLQTRPRPIVTGRSKVPRDGCCLALVCAPDSSFSADFPVRHLPSDARRSDFCPTVCQF